MDDELFESFKARLKANDINWVLLEMSSRGEKVELTHEGNEWNLRWKLNGRWHGGYSGGLNAAI